MRKLNLAGQVFGELTAIEPTTERRQGQVVWRLVCSCGVEVLRVPGNLKRPQYQSCGCKTAQRIRETHVLHGKTYTSEWKRWYDMHCRCKYSSSTVYKYYGGRGIRVCDRWSGDDGFDNFLTDMGPLPSPEFTIERKNSNGHYEPENCIWAPAKRQPRNTRRNLRDANGVAVVDRSEQTDLPHTTVSQRITRLGYDVEEALTKQKFHNGSIPMPERPHSRHRRK